MKSRSKEHISVFRYVGTTRADGSLITYSDLKFACKRVLATRTARLLACRHNNTESPCIMRGTMDGIKAPCVRRCVLERALGLSTSENLAAKPSSHLRAYHLAWIAAESSSIEELELLHSGSSVYEIRHVCGHKDCDEESHLQLGTVRQNEEDKPFHFVLDRCVDPSSMIASFKIQFPDFDLQ